MSRRPTPEQVETFLTTHAYQATEGPLKGLWGVRSNWFTDAEAMKRAEWAMLTGQPLSADPVSMDALLEQARRIADLEERMDQMIHWASMCPDMFRRRTVAPRRYDDSPLLPPEPQPFRNGA